MPVEIDIAVACNYMQHYEWWSEVFANIINEVQAGDITIGKIFTSGTAVLDNAKNRITGAWIQHEKREQMTDANRNKLVGVGADGQYKEDGFMASSAEWVFWMDDDTVPPKGAIKKLLDLRREIVAGLYFLGGAPHNPLAYVRTEEGFYRPLYNYTYGVLTKVDAIGMGCTLIHKDVYRKIFDAHVVYARPNASLIAVPKSAIIQSPYAPGYSGTHVENDVLIMPLSKPGEDDNRAFPFYAMEYGRTEDLHFGELCANAGIDIYIDSTITCKHWKTKAVDYETYVKYARENTHVAGQ